MVESAWATPCSTYSKNRYFHKLHKQINLYLIIHFLLISIRAFIFDIFVIDWSLWIHSGPHKHRKWIMIVCVLSSQCSLLFTVNESSWHFRNQQMLELFRLAGLLFVILWGSSSIHGHVRNEKLKEFCCEPDTAQGSNEIQHLSHEIKNRICTSVRVLSSTQPDCQTLNFTLN